MWFSFFTFFLICNDPYLLFLDCDNKLSYGKIRIIMIRIQWKRKNQCPSFIDKMCCLFFQKKKIESCGTHYIDSIKRQSQAFFSPFFKEKWFLNYRSFPLDVQSRTWKYEHLFLPWVLRTQECELREVSLWSGSREGENKERKCHRW